MRKTNYRDYVVEAMQYYARCGKPNETCIRKLRFTANPKEEPNIRDLEAVERALRRLGSEEYGERGAKAVQMVYFVSPHTSLKRNDITERVHGAAGALHTCESMVYASLRRMRDLVAEERGLRCNENMML